MSKIILVTHQKGGVGKSTLTANLAFNLLQQASVAIVDLDYQGSLYSLKSQFNGIDTYPADTSVEEIQKLNQDFIIIDTPPYLFQNTPKIARISDVVLVPTKAGLLDAIAIGKTLELILTNTEESKILIILNMVKANTTLTNTVYREIKKYGIDIARTRISDLVDFTRSILNKGMLSSKAQYQMDAITKEILHKLI